MPAIEPVVVEIEEEEPETEVEEEEPEVEEEEPEPEFEEDSNAWWTGMLRNIKSNRCLESTGTSIGSRMIINDCDPNK